jgi:hypothetical protein
MDKIDSAESPGDISKAHIEHRKGETSGDSSTKKEDKPVNPKDPLGIL